MNATKVLMDAFVEVRAHFPLDGIKIKLVPVSGERSYTMQVWPKLTALFHPFQMEWRILCHQGRNLSTGLHFEDLLEGDVLKGFLGHELSHIELWSKKSLFKLFMIWRGYNYSPSFFRNEELNADKLAIKRGLGYELLSLTEFIQSHPTVSKRYRENWEQNNMSIEDIRDELYARQVLAQGLP